MSRNILAASLFSRHSLCRLRRRARWTTRLTRFAPSLLALLAVACGRPDQAFYFSDSVSTTVFNWDHEDAVTAPYVQGAEVTLRASGGPPEHDWTGWTIAVDDESVFQIDERDFDLDSVAVDGFAAGAGETTISLLDARGEVAHTATIVVQVPDRAELHARAPQLVDMESLDDLGGDRQILVGGTATFEVRYFLGDERLYGKGVLEAEPDGGLEIDQDTTTLSEDRDWLQVRPLSEGPHEIDLRVGGETFDVFAFDAVGPEAVADLAIHVDDESAAVNGDTVDTIAWMTTADGRPVHGAEALWTLRDAEVGRGDMFEYTYLFGPTSTLTADFDGVRAEVQVHALNGEAWDSDDSLGCSAVGGAGAPAFGFALALIGLVARRRD